MKIKYDGKYPYYEVLPLGFKTAELADFFDGQGKIIMKLPYLLNSEVDAKKYWACRTMVGFMEINDFMLFLEKGRVYVIK